MGLPTQPIPLTAANLAMLQTRQASPQARPDANAEPADPSSPTPPPRSSGRGRLVDILV
jgi:hypothetical protein